MKLSEVSDIFLGSIVSRFEPSSTVDETVSLPMVTMQDINYHSGLKIDVLPERATARILTSKVQQCLFSQPDDLLYGFTQFRSVVVKDDLAGMLVPSNLALIRIKNNAIDPFYLMWILNEGSCSKDKIFPHIQGIGVVKLLKTTDLRELEIGMPPPIEKQRKIGNLYRLILERKKVLKAINDKEDLLLLETIRNMERGNK